MRRPRGPGGRFLTAAEVEAQGLDPEGGGEGGSPDGSGNGTSTPGGTTTAGGKKRKAGAVAGAKKKKKGAEGTASPSPPMNDEDVVDDLGIGNGL